MRRNQFVDDLDALVRDSDDFPPVLRRLDWFDEHEREESRRDLTTDRNGSRVIIVVSGGAQLVHDSGSIRIQMVRLPPLAPGNPRLLAAISLAPVRACSL